MKYRKEIDGLRALAVLPVIFFHAGFEVFSGGFVGVDIFFVISGFLITSIILLEKQKGTFSLLNFYERRARRIIPALFLVMITSVLFSWLWLAPKHMQDFSQSLLAVSTFSSNILFWLESGYWGTANELKPLLHTWSLAVEEQYYLLFPLFLLLMWRFEKRWILTSFFIVSLLSLTFSEMLSFSNPEANFFLLSTRAWELAIGAGVAFYFVFRKSEINFVTSSKHLDELLSAIGLCLIFSAIFLFDETTRFPGIYALVPTVGTALIIIFASNTTVIGKLLGSKPFVAIGLISYSAYLWHQPLFAFARQRSLTDPTPLTYLVLSTLSLLLAFLSWKFVEGPFRNKLKVSRSHIFTFTLAGSAFFMAFGIAGHVTDGFDFRVNPQVVNRIEQSGDKLTADTCPKGTGTLPLIPPLCQLTSGSDSAAILYGDSHARALRDTLSESFAKSEHSLLYVSQTACPPVKGVYRADRGNENTCYSHNQRIIEFIINEPSIEYVILTARWTLGMEGARFDNLEGGVELGRKPHLDIVNEGRFLFHKDYSHQALLKKAYIETVESFLDAGKKVILVYPVPEAGWHVPDYLMKHYLIYRQDEISPQIASTDYTTYLKRNEKTLDALDAIRDDLNLARINPAEILCNSIVSGRCVTHDNGTSFYMDDDHLNAHGAALVVKKVMEQVNELKTTGTDYTNH